MRNQFFYTAESPEGKPARIGSFAIDYVIRTMQYDGNKIVVLLDDFHELTRTIPQSVGKNGKAVMKTISEVTCSEIYLNEEDSIRFMELSSVYVPSKINQEKQVAVETLA